MMNKKQLLSLSLLLLVVFFINAQSEFKDTRNKKLYKVIKVGDQEWMQRNIYYKTLNSWEYENNIYTNLTGLLYSWEDANKVCPDGWHLPTNNEWDKLLIFLDAGAKKYDNKAFLVADKLKIDNKYIWTIKKNEKLITEKSNNLNSSNFSAYPSGMRSYEGGFYLMGIRAIFWSSSYEKNEQTDYNKMYSYIIRINSNIVEKKNHIHPMRILFVVLKIQILLVMD